MNSAPSDQDEQAQLNRFNTDDRAPAPRKILWVAEAVTLAHIARPLAVQRSLPAEGWLSTIACDARAKCRQKFCRRGFSQRTGEVYLDESGEY